MILIMSDPKKDDDFNETLKRMLDAPPKPHEEMKKGKSRNETAKKPDKDHRGS